MHLRNGSEIPTERDQRAEEKSETYENECADDRNLDLPGGAQRVFVEPDGKNTRRLRAMTEFARVDGERVWYPGEGELFG